MSQPSAPTPGSRAPLTVAVINDFEIIVRGLQEMLTRYGDDIDVVQVPAGGRLGRPVDIALYDMFSQSPLAEGAAARIAAHPLIGAAVVYSWEVRPELVQTVWEQGMRGYLSKMLPAQTLIDALRRIHAGERVLHPMPDGPDWQKHLEWVSTGSDPEVGDWPAREVLTARQAEVIALITQGYTNDQIAQRTYLSPNTVKSYIREAYRRMGVTRRSQAVAWGMQNGLMPDRESATSIF